MKPGTRVRLVALPMELWTPWPDGALPADEVARLAGQRGTVIQGANCLPYGCVLLVTDAKGVTAEDDGDGIPTLYGFIVPVAALAVVTVEPETATRAPTLPDPWRPGAHDEERLAAGGILHVTALALPQVKEIDKVAPLPDGLRPAPGGAGRWRVVQHYACGGAPMVGMMRWLVPVQP